MFVSKLYDSHVHLMSTGQVRCEWDLSELSSVQEIGRLPRDSKYRRGDWFQGFGWDENKWSPRIEPHREILDRFFPDDPVCLARADGHSAWLNTKGLRAFGYDIQRDPSLPPEVIGGQVRRDAGGFATGILTENAYYSRLGTIPAPTELQVRSFLAEGLRVFNAAGFTHVRDMAGSHQQWTLAREMEDSGRWTLQVDWNFTCENIQDFERALKEALAAKREESPLNRVRGIKFYMDGALGSDTARLSQDYAHRDDGVRGLFCWPESDVKDLIRRTWDAGLEVAAHSIGDEASDLLVRLAREVSSAGGSGRLNLEHVEVLRKETIQLMKGLHVVCHIQPCHYLSDRRWLKDKLGGLYTSAFPWEALRRMGIPFHFGSDSPIERPSLFDNLRALEESRAAGIPALAGDPLQFHVHPDPKSCDSRTRFEGSRVREVRLLNRVVYADDSV